MMRRLALAGCLLVGLLPAVLRAGPMAEGSGLAAHTPLAQANTLSAVSCDAAGRCLAIGQGGAALASTNGGATWSVRAGTHMASPRALSCSTRAVCVAVGTKGTIRTTANSGRSWHRRHTGTSKDLESVSCTTMSSCVAVGLDGAVLTSADAGSSWSDHSVDATMGLWGVSCPTPTACVVVGNVVRPGTTYTVPLILTSANGGATWTRRPAAPHGSLGAVSCWSATACVAAGSQDGTERTADGGATWSKPDVDEQASELLTNLSCLGPSSCVALGITAFTGSLPGNAWVPTMYFADADHLIERTRDGGRTWQHVYANYPGWPKPPVAVTCRTVARCVAVGGDGIIEGSADGGVTWTRQR